ncbi:glycoside hydrolase family 16 protein [Mucilaginibacter paludis]|uniref:Glycoside hydrolase family 16 n=1 Tax=Mucilaginibacter paludis DSM 18603 TaxID=714943 RepID=H1Y8J8_9SPHI|nr:glycoside hydrolase family 16 protein [Mucilaginibacter paludis]EHQ25916.1 glycoside hydrolase family 16 [Mucilaginibacter paludis DSM 18603]
MKLNIYFNCLMLACVSLSAYAKKATPPTDTPKVYKLVWADEFNRNGPPNAANWKFENGFVRNNELQWYQQQNAWCRKGLLVIEARKEHLPNPNYSAQSDNWRNSRSFIDYTSSSINTAGLHSWKYGRFVMRAKIDTSAGLWPAFWALGVSGEWPSSGEIDMMEYYKKKLLANIACGTAVRYKAKWYSNSKPISEFTDKKWASKFHIWRMDWDEKGISLYVDDFLMNHVDLKDLVNADGSNPFNQPQYLLLNLALGGDNGGDPSLTKFPRRFEIDYVRVYQ